MPGHVIRRARKLAGLSQAQLAARLGTTQSAISRWEKDATSPRVVNLRDAVNACGYDLWLGLSELDGGPGGLRRDPPIG